jgi:hypothetical protein
MLGMLENLLLSVERAGHDGLRSGIFTFGGIAGVVGIAFVVVMALAPPRLPSQADRAADSPVGAVNRVARVVYGPAPNDTRCRRFQFDNRTAALEQIGASDCSAKPGRGLQQDGHSNLGVISDAFRRRAQDD